MNNILNLANGALGRFIPSSSISSSVNKSTYEESFDARIRPILDAVEKVRDTIESAKPSSKESKLGQIRLPSIVVVGDQSAAKSSVLEALSRFPLPRGTNITTRCPIVVRTVVCANEQSSRVSIRVPSCGLEEHIPFPQSASSGDESLGTQPNPFCSSSSSTLASRWESAASEAILRATSAVAGAGTDVSSECVFVEVQRPGIAPLTVVDLPGITRTPVGDQSPDIYSRVRSLIESHIQKQETLILAVVPANVDLATCECLALARHYDPTGERTLAVLTKSDLAESKMLPQKLNELTGSMRVSLGAVAVRLRSAQDTAAGLTVELALEREKQFFAQHPDKARLPPNSCGTEHLVSLLTKLQAQQIERQLPSLNEALERAILNLENDIAQLPAPCASPSDRLFAAIRTCETVSRQWIQEALQSALYEAIRDFAFEVQSHWLRETSPFQPKVWRTVETHLKRQQGVSLPNLISHGIVANAFVDLCSEESHVLVEKFIDSAKESLRRLRIVSTNPSVLDRKIGLWVEEFISSSSATAFQRCCEFLNYEKTVYVVKQQRYESELAQIKRVMDSMGEGKKWDAANLSDSVRDILSLYDSKTNNDALPWKQHESKSAREIVLSLAIYARIAAERWTESCGLCVRHFMAVDFNRNLEDYLKKRVRMLTDAEMEDLMQDSAEFEVKRKEWSRLLQELRSRGAVLSQAASSSSAGLVSPISLS